jgi:hypothetical protein
MHLFMALALDAAPLTPPELRWQFAKRTQDDITRLVDFPPL